MILSIIKSTGSIRAARISSQQRQIVNLNPNAISAPQNWKLRNTGLPGSARIYVPHEEMLPAWLFSAQARDLRCSNRFAGRALFVLRRALLLKSQQKVVS